MKNLKLIAPAALLALAGCGLEGYLSNALHTDYERPASAFSGTLPKSGTAEQLAAIDGDGKDLGAFQITAANGSYDLRLPSSKYSFVRVAWKGGTGQLRALVPAVGEETRITKVNLDARGMTEALIVEAWLSYTGKKFKVLSPEVYLGTRSAILAAFDTAGPTQDLLKMVERVLAKLAFNVVVDDAYFFRIPAFKADGSVKTSALNPDFLARESVDYDGDGSDDSFTDKFDAKLLQVLKLYDPSGCKDPDKIRVVLTSDFNDGRLSGNCTKVDRFKWATDKPGKKMFFVGWVHVDSKIQDPVVHNQLGGGTPNTIPMYDDGTNGDEVAGDNIWTVVFDLPRGNGTDNVLRIGYKYTWGERGKPWTGSEEWPGNSRILEVVDVNGDEFVYRRDTFGDEATNKDKSNLNVLSSGTIGWTTDLRGFGPESHEQKVNLYPDCNDITKAQWITPQSVGPRKVACTGP